MFMIRSVLLASVLLTAGIPAEAQSSNPQHATPGVPTQQQPPPQTGAPQQKIIVRTQQVLVPVTVKEGPSQLVAGLEKSDFQIFCDGVEQRILLFDANPFPLSAVVLLDNNLATKEAKQVQKSLVSISAGFGPTDEVAVMKYQSYPEPVSDFSFNNDVLFTVLKRMEIGSHSLATYGNDPTAMGSGPVVNGQQLPTGRGVPLHGSARPANDIALDDAVYAAAQMLEGRGINRRKIIFLVSDGSNSRHNIHTFGETLRLLLESNISVYSISVSHSVPGRSIFEHGIGQADRYAIASGGDVFYGAKEDDLDRLYSLVTEEARNQYTLTFSPHGEDKTKDYHTIEVRVRRPGVDVLARAGYYQSALGIAQ
jgi:VWFA-related protein